MQNCYPISYFLYKNLHDLSTHINQKRSVSTNQFTKRVKFTPHTMPRTKKKADIIPAIGACSVSTHLKRERKTLMS